MVNLYSRMGESCNKSCVITLVIKCSYIHGQSIVETRIAKAAGSTVGWKNFVIRKTVLWVYLLIYIYFFQMNFSLLFFLCKKNGKDIILCL